jgi:hypothetical protein
LSDYDRDWPTTVTRPSHADGTVLRLKASVSGQFLQHPIRAGAEWDDSSPGDPKPKPKPDQNGHILIPVTDYPVEWDFVTDPDIESLREDYVGTVNDADFLDCPAESLLCQGFSIEPSVRMHSSDPFAWKITAQIKHRHVRDGAVTHGWNHDYRADPPGWARVQVGGANRYASADWSGMFS